MVCRIWSQLSHNAVLQRKALKFCPWSYTGQTSLDNPPFRWTWSVLRENHFSSLIASQGQWEMESLKAPYNQATLAYVCFTRLSLFSRIIPTESNYISCMKALSSNKQIAAVQVMLSVESWKRSCFLPFTRLHFSPCRLFTLRYSKQFSDSFLIALTLVPKSCRVLAESKSECCLWK